MKLREIDEKLYEFSLGDLIKLKNLGTGIRQLGKDGVKQSAYNYFKNNIPNYLNTVADKRAQEKRRRKQKQKQKNTDRQYRIAP